MYDWSMTDNYTRMKIHGYEKIFEDYICMHIGLCIVTWSCICIFYYVLSVKILYRHTKASRLFVTLTFGPAKLLPYRILIHMEPGGAHTRGRGVGVRAAWPQVARVDSMHRGVTCGGHGRQGQKRKKMDSARK